MGDTGRKYDIEELYKERQTAKNGFWRDLYDKKIDQIMRESGKVRAERENLIKAIRGNDIRAIKRANMELTKIKQEEYRGNY